jgi:hypothetical protein
MRIDSKMWPARLTPMFFVPEDCRNIKLRQFLLVSEQSAVFGALLPATPLSAFRHSYSLQPVQIQDWTYFFLSRYGIKCVFITNFAWSRRYFADG